MLAVVYADHDALPAVTEVAEPACPEDGVVIAVRATGVCRSDWHAWKGHDPVPLPHTPGHEFAGVVAEVGARVAGWQVGDRVTVPFVCGCGRCAWCAGRRGTGLPRPDAAGLHRPGVVRREGRGPCRRPNLVRLPDAVDFVTAASLGCRFATAFRARDGARPAPARVTGSRCTGAAASGCRP